MENDLLNGLFEVVAGILLGINVYQLHKDKQIRGVSILPMAFFMLWGYWNLYFYPSVNCPLSFWGSLLVVVTNTIWVGQMIYYGRRGKK